METKEDDQWIEFRPRNFAFHWSHQASRKAMAECARVYKDTGKLDIVTYSKLVATCGPDGEGGYAPRFIQFADPNYRPDYASFRLPSQSALVEILAKLDPQQLKRLEKGETIPYEQLSPAVRALARRAVYGIRVNVEEEGALPQGIAEDEPTLELPNGLLERTGIAADMSEETIVCFHNGESEYDDVFYEADLAAGNVGEWMGPPPRIPSTGMAATTFDIRTRKQITLKCELSPGHYIVGTFEEPLPAATKKPVPLKELAVDVQKQLKATIDFLGQIGHFGHGDDTSPPPP